MAAITRTPRSTWIEEGLRALAASGPDAVRVEVLAQALGVTKGGFYGHFADRNALLEEMLDTWERRATDEALERVERKGGDARARLRRAGGLTFARDLLPIDLAVRDWARRDPAVAGRLRRVDNRRMEYLRGMFSALGADEDEAEARSMLAFSLMIGHHFMAAEHGARTHEDVLELAARWLLAPGSAVRWSAPRNLTAHGVGGAVSGSPWNTSIATAITVHASLADGSPYENIFNQFMHMRWGRVTEIRTLENTEVLQRAMDRLAATGYAEAHAAPITDQPAP